MFQFLLGLSLSVYSVFVLKMLRDWRIKALNLVKEIVKSGEDLLLEGKQLLEPVKDAADSTRKSVDKIDSIAENLKKNSPTKLKELTQNLNHANEALIKLHPEINAALQELPLSLIGILNEVIEFLEKRSPDLISLSADIKRLSLIIDDPNPAKDKDIVAIINKIRKKLHESGNYDSLSETLRDAGARLDKAADSLATLAFVLLGGPAPLTLAFFNPLSAVPLMRNFADALTVTDALDGVAEDLKQAGAIHESASNTLLEANEAIDQVKPALDDAANKISKFSADFIEKALKLKPYGALIINQTGKLQLAIDENYPTLVASLNNIVTEIETLDITTSLGEVQDTTAKIKKIANLIDDGSDVDSPDKKDFYQTINNILKILTNLLRTGETFEQIFKPLYLIIVALHVLLLVIGLLLVIFFLISLRNYIIII